MLGIFRNLFNKKKPVNVDAPTKPIRQESIEAVLQPLEIEILQPPQLIAASGLSVGKQREHNEDALFTLTTSLTSDKSNLPFGLYIVADGMGGHQYGEVASRVAVRAMATHVINNLYLPLLKVVEQQPDESLQEIMQTGVMQAHKAIIENVPGGGTTLTAALILGQRLVLAHVGDSRAYLIGGNPPLEAITRDHSLVNRLVELGQITSAEAAEHPQRNVLYRALGQGEPFEPDIKSLVIESAPYLLLCSDGLWGVIAEEQLFTAVVKHDRPEHACQFLLEAANDAGGPDNIAVILIRLPAE